VSNPRSERITVVLPAPFGPTSPTTAPRGIVNEMSSISRVGRVMRRSEIRTISSVISFTPPCLFKATAHLIKVDSGMAGGQPELEKRRVDALRQFPCGDSRIDLRHDEAAPMLVANETLGHQVVIRTGDGDDAHSQVRRQLTQRRQSAARR